jgi:hypothetical protein
MSRMQSTHPSASALLAWVAGTDDAALASHVASCERCRQAAADWRTVGLQLREDLVEEADAAFTGERLAHQRAEVMRRVRGGGARVLRFPAPAAPAVHRSRVFGADLRRWIAAAALVGLVVGTLAGRFLLDPHGPQATDASRRATEPQAGVPSLPMLTGLPVSDEAFLVELDAAVYSSSPRALRAIDALTPGADR